MVRCKINKKRISLLKGTFYCEKSTSFIGKFVKNEINRQKICSGNFLQYERPMDDSKMTFMRDGRYENHENPCFSYRLAGMRDTTVPCDFL